MTPKFPFEISWPLLVSVKSSFSNKYLIHFFLSFTGCFFTLARSILLVDVPSICHEKIWKITQVTLAVVFGIIAVVSLIPALFGSLIWKVGQFAIEAFGDDDWISKVLWLNHESQHFLTKLLFFWILAIIFSTVCYNTWTDLYNMMTWQPHKKQWSCNINNS